MLNHKIKADLCLLLLLLARTFNANDLLENNKDIVGGALTRHNMNVKRERQPLQLSNVEPTKEQVCMLKSEFEENKD